MAKHVVTSGVFPVPSLPAAMGASLQFYISSYENEQKTAAWSVYTVEREGVKNKVRAGLISVPARGMRQLSLLPRLVEGQLVELKVMLPSKSLLPSCAIVISFIAVESRSTALRLLPGEFAELPNGVNG